MRAGHEAWGLWYGLEKSRTPISGRARRPRAPGSSRGFSLVAVLFLIVVIAALGAFAVRIGAGQQQTVNLALLGARALSAANAGIEFGAYQALQGGGACATSTLAPAGALSGFIVLVECSSTTHVDGGGTNVYRIVATATYGNYGQPDYVSRQMYATFMDQL